MSLDKILTRKSPLGPIDQINVRDLLDAAALLEDVSPFALAHARASTVIIGRKGSGKTSVISGYLARAEYGQTHGIFTSEDKLKEAEKSLVIHMDDWAHFHKLVNKVAKIIYSQLPHPHAYEFLFPESASEAWIDAIWDVITEFFYTYAVDHPESRKKLAPVINVFTLQTIEDVALTDKDIEQKSLNILNEAKISIQAYLKSINKKCYVLFDNMEKYPVMSPVFSTVIGGFIRAINAINANDNNIRLVYCLPEEIERFAISQTSNLEKDYESMHRIRWSVSELLLIVAHRYRLFVSTVDEEYYRELLKLDLNKRRDIQLLFNKMLTGNVVNGLGKIENPIAYIIRHTQLIPRHFIMVFNSIISRSIHANQGYKNIKPEFVRAGVEEVEATIAQHVLHLYGVIYPNFLYACQDVLTQLPPICSLSQLHKIERQFKDRIEETASANPWRILADIGVLGVVEEQKHAGHADRYIYGGFHFNTNGRIGFANDRLYCFHPIFSKFYNMKRSGPDINKAVYPSNVGMPSSDGSFPEEFFG